MGPAVRAQILFRGLLQERQTPLARCSQSSQHLLFAAQQTVIQRKGGFAPYDPVLHQPHRKMKSLQKRNWFRIFLRDAIRAAKDGAFHHHQVGHQFGGGPFVWVRFSVPLICRNGVGRPEKPCLGATQLFANGIEAPHASTLSGTSSPGRLPEHGEYWTPHRCLPSCPVNCRHRLQRHTADLLKCVGKLQHASFCKRRSKDLQPHGQLARHPPARHRDAWQAR